MIKSVKIRLLPNKEQEVLMFKSIGCSRFAYNWALNRCNELYQQGVKYNMSNIRKEFTQLKKRDEFKWLNEVSNTTMVESMRNLDLAFKRFFKTNYDIPKGRNICKFSNPYCSFDGKYWYLSFGFEVEENQTTLNKDLSIGIDLGIKYLAICSNGMLFKNVNKTKKVKKLKKRLKRLQRQVSRKYEANKQGNKFVKTNNIIKLEKQIKLLHRKLSNIRNNHIHQATNKIIKLKPYRVVMEDLNVKGMMKNKHLSKAIQEQGFYEFIRQMKYKCEFNGIQFIQADRYFPSSKMCSCCGKIKHDLKLKDRVYKCDCGLEIDRDKNASINLSNYGLA